MTKFDITQMADLVRGLMDPETEQQMRTFLQSSNAPSSSKKELSALRHVARLAEIDRNLEVPDYAVRCAKALGSLRRPEAQEASILKRLAMALTFDSHVAPAFGTRDMRSADRQLVFQSRGFQIDLRLEVDKKGKVVVGQLIRDGKNDVEPVADVPILAMAEEQIIARAQTGALGEFQAEGLNAEMIDLLFLVDDEQCLEVSLGESY